MSLDLAVQFAKHSTTRYKQCSQVYKVCRLEAARVRGCGRRGLHPAQEHAGAAFLCRAGVLLSTLVLVNQCSRFVLQHVAFGIMHFGSGWTQ